MEELSHTCDIFATWKVSPDLCGLTEALRPLQAGGVSAPGTWAPPHRTLQRHTCGDLRGWKIQGPRLDRADEGARTPLL
ncbi:hypothetical protein NDU88_001881 [Pleurodeles waltl]|uniref:Uncharacterized protein n=1 Tax=Pleurodeles waltl TaxID=8319 RepID=A0AAV7V9L6_PLEWA|nr:hypothetical protein NDU88_001881 [Pleurodeles waltl]